MAYDPKNATFVLFGGSTKSGNVFTWTYNPRTRERHETRSERSPDARCAYKLCGHDSLGATVLFGGARQSKNGWPTDYQADLWVYETAADRWTEVKTATAPPPCASALCYDASQDLLVLFNEKGQTWTCKIERAVDDKP